MIPDVDPGSEPCFFYPYWIPDPGVKKAQDSRSRIRNTIRNLSIRLRIRPPTRPSNKYTKKPLERILKLFEGNTRVSVKLLMIILFKLSKKVGFGFKKTLWIRPALVSEFDRIRIHNARITQQLKYHNKTRITSIDTGPRW
jgi:hypothetical protein